MKHIFIINPTAGKIDSSSILSQKIQSAVKSHEICHDIYITKSAGEIEGYMKNAINNNQSEKLRFYICGGDGSISEAVSAAALNPNVELGCIPVGSGNDFVKNFPDCDFFDISKQITALSKEIDLIYTSGKYCINIASVGFDAKVAYNMNKFKRIPFIGGNAAYSFSVIYSLLSRINMDLKYSIDGGELVSGKYLLASFANGFCYGGHYKAAPYAKVDDGQMDFCAVSKISRAKILNLMKIFEAGEHPEKLPDLTTYKKCRSVKIYGKKPLKINIDGDIHIMESPEFKIYPKAIKFLLP